MLAGFILNENKKVEQFIKIYYIAYFSKLFSFLSLFIFIFVLLRVIIYLN